MVSVLQILGWKCRMLFSFLHACRHVNSVASYFILLTWLISLSEQDVKLFVAKSDVSMCTFLSFGSHISQSVVPCSQTYAACVLPLYLPHTGNSVLNLTLRDKSAEDRSKKVFPSGRTQKICSLNPKHGFTKTYTRTCNTVLWQQLSYTREKEAPLIPGRSFCCRAE
jgi:hypothetical protein